MGLIVVFLRYHCFAIGGEQVSTRGGSASCSRWQKECTVVNWFGSAGMPNSIQSQSNPITSVSQPWFLQRIQFTTNAMPYIQIRSKWDKHRVSSLHFSAVVLELWSCFVPESGRNYVICWGLCGKQGKQDKQTKHILVYATLQNEYFKLRCTTTNL